MRPLASTWAYYAAFVALGLTSASLGPTLPALAEQTGSALGQVSFLFTTRSTGYLIGSVLAGQLYDRVAGHPLMAAMIVLLAVMLFLTPLSPLLWLVAAVLLVLGVGEGLIDVGGNTLIVWIHRSKVGPYMNGLHFFFGVGAALSPLIVAVMAGWAGGIAAAYWALALIILPVSGWLLTLRSPARISARDAAAAGGTRVGLALMIAVFMFLYVGSEIGFGGWVYTYALRMGLADERGAAGLTSIFWGALTVGRLAAIPIATRFRPRTILAADMIGSLASIGVILWFDESPLAAYIGAAGTGFAMASVFPTVLAWAERRMAISGRVTSWFFIGASLGGMIFPWVAGQLFEAYGPQATMAAIWWASLAATVVFGVVMAMGGPPHEERQPRSSTSRSSASRNST